MSGRRAPQVVLSAQERAELERLASRRKTAQRLAPRARVVLVCAEGHESNEVAARLRVAPARSGSGASALPHIVWKGCTTNRARAPHARSTTPGSRR